MAALSVERVVRGGFNSTFATKIILKEAWQVQRDDSRQHGAGMGKHVADEEKKEFKIDVRVHTVFHKQQSIKVKIEREELKDQRT